MSTLRFVFTGGGTGGHVYPNVAVYEVLKDRYPDAEFLYLGTRSGAEAKIVPGLPQPIPFRAVPSRGLPANLRSLRSLPALGVILLGAWRSFFLLRRFRPHLVIGSGGYVSAPVLLAAALLRIKILIHEQNAVPGRLNQLMARFATRIATAFPSSSAFFPAHKTVLTGYPLRRSIVSASARDVRARLHIPERNRVLLVCSGSMGARTINRAVAEIVPSLLAMENVTVILSTGKAYNRDYRAYDDTVGILQSAGIPTEIGGRLIVREYFDPISDLYAVADLAIARAGAGTVKELSTVGLPALLIPKLDLPSDHQVLNAREMEKTGGARVLNEEVRLHERRRHLVVPEVPLLQAVRDLLDNPAELQRMRGCLQSASTPDSAARIAREADLIIGRPERIGSPARRTHYLHETESESNHDIPFGTVIAGHSWLADVFLDQAPPDSLFAIRFLDPAHQQAALKRIRGPLSRNGEPVRGWVQLHEKDEIQLGDLRLTFAGYSEDPQPAAPEDEPTGKAPVRVGRLLAAHALSLLRECIQAALFGAGRILDTFVAAQAVVRPAMRLVGGPLWKKSLEANLGQAEAPDAPADGWRDAAAVSGLTWLLAAAISAAGVMLADPLCSWLMPGLSSSTAAAPAMLRLLFPAAALASLAAFQSTLLGMTRHQRTVQASLLIGHSGAIIILLLTGRSLQPQALGYAMLGAAFLQFLFMLPFALAEMRRLGIPLRVRLRPGRAASRRYARDLGGVAADILPGESVRLVSFFLAGFMKAGAVACLHIAWVILSIPLSVSGHVVESLTQPANGQRGDDFVRPERARQLLLDGLAVLLSLLVPIAILLIILAPPLTSLLFERLRFDARASTAAALALQLLAIGLPAWGVQRFLRRFFENRLEKNAERLVDLALLTVHALLAAWLIRTPLGFAGIALAASLAATLLTGPRLFLLVRRIRADGATMRLGDLVAPLRKIIPACLLMILGVVQARFVFHRIPFRSTEIEHALQVVSLSFMGMAIFLLSSLMLKNTALLVFRRRAGGGALPLALLPPGRFLEAVAANPAAFRSEFRYKISLYTSSASWAVKNVGIKLIGLFREKSRLPVLLDALQDRRSNGFVRRNALQALRELQVWDGAVQAAVTARLRDRYYEVRVAALQCLASGMNSHDFPALRDHCRKRLRRGPIEEKIACLRLIARKGGIDDLAGLEPFYLNSNSLVREELAELLSAFHRRGLLGREELRERVARILITSNNLAAEFRIKSIVSRIHRDLEAT